jgi:multiple sugar transport system permease protein
MKRQSVVGRISRAAIIAFFISLVLVPYFFEISTSLKTTEDVRSIPPKLIPEKVQLENYAFVFRSLPLGRYFLNSLFISLMATAFVVAIATFSAYAFSRLRFPGRNLIGILQLATEMIPPILFLVPYYMIFLGIQTITSFKMIGTYHGLILTYIAFNLPVTTWFMRGYLDTISTSLEESAFIDGCSRTRALISIIVPIVLPGIITIAILTFIMTWNEVLFASVLTNEFTKTVSLGIRDYRTKLVVNWNFVMAAGVITSIPSLIVFTFLQKYLISGMTLGAVKE